MSRFLRPDTAPSAHSPSSAATARRSRGRSAIVDLVPLVMDPDMDLGRDNDNVFQNDDHDHQDDDFAVVRPSPTPSPPDSPGRQLAEFYLGAASHLLHHPDDDELDPTERDHQEPAGNDSLLDFPPTPSTIHSPHSASNRSSIGSRRSAGGTRSHIHSAYIQPTSPLSSSSSSTAVRRTAIPPPLPLPVQLQVQHQPDDDPFGFAVVERRIQLTRPYTQAPSSTAYSSKSPSVSVPPPSQRAPSSSLFSSTPTHQQLGQGQGQEQELDSDMLPPLPMSPLSSLHLTADTPVRDSLDPTLHPPPFSATSPIQRQDSPLPSPLSPLSPARPKTPSAAATDPAPTLCADTTDDDDDIFTFKPTSRAAQTQLRVTSAMHAALHPSAAAAGPKKYTRKAAPVARMAKRKTEAEDVFEFAGDNDKDVSAAAVESKKKPVAAKRKPRAPRNRAQEMAGPVQVTRFLGELIGMPSSSPSPPRRAPLPQRVDDGFSSDVDAHPIAKPAPTKKAAAAAPPKKRGAAATAKKPPPPTGAENIDPFALPEDLPGQAQSKPRGRAGAAAARNKRTSAERLAEGAADKHQGNEPDDQGSPRKRTRTRTSGSGACAGDSATAKRVTRSRRGAAAELEE